VEIEADVPKRLAAQALATPMATAERGGRRA